MEWADLYTFMKSRDPAYLRSVTGVSREEIVLCEESCGIALPRLYVEFLATMGAGSGDFHPFGASHSCNFHDLVDQLPAEDYPADKYFKVAFENDPSAVAWYDKFLDLERSSENDAPLVEFEDSGVFALANVQEVGFTLEGWLTRRIFGFFELNRLPHRARVSLYCTSRPELHRSMEAATALLAETGLESALSCPGQVTCYHGRAASALVANRATPRESSSNSARATVTLSASKSNGCSVIYPAPWSTRESCELAAPW